MRPSGENCAIVGNRLDIELDIEFFKYLEKAIKIIPNLKFKIIGEQPKLDLISKKLLKNIEFISFISDLENYFIENIDFYLNPKRVGGGQSSIISIKANIPVITLAYGDVYSAIQKKYFINSFDEIADFIKNYIEDKDFKIKIDNMNKEILIDSSKVFEDMIRTIVKI
jgi:glycosyltransferase involved in cell wall biosynthesis